MVALDLPADSPPNPSTGTGPLEPLSGPAQSATSPTEAAGPLLGAEQAVINAVPADAVVVRDEDVKPVLRGTVDRLASVDEAGDGDVAPEEQAQDDVKPVPPFRIAEEDLPVNGTPPSDVKPKKRHIGYVWITDDEGSDADQPKVEPDALVAEAKPEDGETTTTRRLRPRESLVKRTAPHLYGEEEIRHPARPKRKSTSGGGGSGRPSKRRLVAYVEILVDRRRQRMPSTSPAPSSSASSSYSSSREPVRSSRQKSKRHKPRPAGLPRTKGHIRNPATNIMDPVVVFQVPERQAQAIATRHFGLLEWMTVPGIGRTRVHTKYLNQFFYWMAERQRIEIRKAAGAPKDTWTHDVFFKEPFRHSNCFRQLDRTSKYIIKDVLEEYRPAGFGDAGFTPDPADERFDAAGNWVDSMREAFFRVMLVWQFGKTWPYEALRRELGDVCLRTYNERRYAAVLAPARAAFERKEGEALFTGSYFIFVDKRYGAGAPMYVRALRHCHRMATQDPQGWTAQKEKRLRAGLKVKKEEDADAVIDVDAEDVEADGRSPMRTQAPPNGVHKRDPGVPGFFATSKNLRECVSFVQAYWGMGNYHSLQLTLHLSYSRWMAGMVATDWIVAGRGAKNGLTLILPDISQANNTSLLAMQWLVSQQEDQWRRFGYSAHLPESMAGSGGEAQEGVTLTEIENSLCLWQKYARLDRKRDDGILDYSKDEETRVKEEDYY